jgi:CheY-like chemotaxis protein
MSMPALSSLAELLRFEDCAVLGGNSGSESVTCLNGRRPVVALFDLSMPRINGLLLDEHIRHLKKPIPLSAATTGWGDEEITTKVLAAKFHHHFLKGEAPLLLCGLLKDHARQIGRAFGRL